MDCFVSFSSKIKNLSNELSITLIRSVFLEKIEFEYQKLKKTKCAFWNFWRVRTTMQKSKKKFNQSFESITDRSGQDY